MHIHTHPSRGGGGGGSELQTKSVTLWHFFGSVVRVSSAHRLLNKWIWNDLPRVSATWAQEHALLPTYTPTPTYTHNTRFFPLSLLFIQRRWRTDTPRGGKREILLCRPESHYLTNTEIYQCEFFYHTVYTRILWFELIYTYLFSDIMENMTEVTLRIANSLTSASPSTSTSLSSEISTIAC